MPSSRGDGWAMRAHFPESRQAYAAMLDDGWIDAVRRIHPEKGIYTYWNFSYRGGYDRSLANGWTTSSLGPFNL